LVLFFTNIHNIYILQIITKYFAFLFDIKGCRYSFMKKFPIIDFIQTLCMSRTWCCTIKKQIKIRPYRGFLFFISYQRCHILNIFISFIRLVFRHKIIECITRISYIINFFQLNTFYFTNKLLYIAIQITKHK